MRKKTIKRLGLYPTTILFQIDPSFSRCFEKYLYVYLSGIHESFTHPELCLIYVQFIMVPCQINASQTYTHIMPLA